MIYTPGREIPAYAVISPLALKIFVNCGVKPDELLFDESKKSRCPLKSGICISSPASAWPLMSMPKFAFAVRSMYGPTYAN